MKGWCVIPVYEFYCKKCGEEYEEITVFDKTGRYSGVKCPSCGSRSKDKLMSRVSSKFDNPKETSKWDSFSYRAGYNMEKAQGERRAAEAASHVGEKPYSNIDDISNGKHFGEVK